MSREQMVRAAQVEIRRLNERIDRKIIRGLSYSPEARRHKFLLQVLHGRI